MPLAKECFYTGGGVWISVVPFFSATEHMVMVVDSEDISIATVYRQKPLDELFYEENIVFSVPFAHLPSQYHKEYQEALALLVSTIHEHK